MSLTLNVNKLSGGVGRRDIIKDISFTASAGITGIIGKNGAGKTTLIKALISPACRHGGEIKISENGREIDLNRLSGRERARYLAYSPQETKSAFACTARDFVIMGRAPYLKGLQSPSKADGDAADKALSELDITHLSDRYTNELSGGERRLVYLARARAQGARWMLLDEPASGLDFGRENRFFESLARLTGAGGTGALVSIHSPVTAYRYCDSIMVLESGRLLMQAEKNQADFDSLYIAALKKIYGEEISFAETDKGKTIIWAGEAYDKN